MCVCVCVCGGGGTEVLSGSAVGIHVAKYRRKNSIDVSSFIQLAGLGSFVAAPLVAVGFAQEKEIDFFFFF